MKRDGLKYYAIFLDDFYGHPGVRQMSHAVRTFYLDLLCQAAALGGAIPDPCSTDGMRKLSRIIGASPKRIAQLWPGCAAEWFALEDQPEVLTNKRLQAELKQYRERSTQASANAQERWSRVVPDEEILSPPQARTSPTTPTATPGPSAGPAPRPNAAPAPGPAPTASLTGPADPQAHPMHAEWQRLLNKYRRMLRPKNVTDSGVGLWLKHCRLYVNTAELAKKLDLAIESYAADVESGARQGPYMPANFVFDRKNNSYPFLEIAVAVDVSAATSEADSSTPLVDTSSGPQYIPSEGY